MESSKTILKWQTFIIAIISGIISIIIFSATKYISDYAWKIEVNNRLNILETSRIPSLEKDLQYKTSQIAALLSNNEKTNIDIAISKRDIAEIKAGQDEIIKKLDNIPRR